MRSVKPLIANGPRLTAAVAGKPIGFPFTAGELQIVSIFAGSVRGAETGVKESIERRRWAPVQVPVTVQLDSQ